MKNFFTLSVMLLFAVFSQVKAADPVSHAKWDELLKKHVSAKGNVSYKGFKTDMAKLDEYLKLLTENQPKSTWTSNQKKAYWINAYNAYTVKLILINYPIKSIKDINKLFGGPWKMKFFDLGEAKDLDHIEHQILRKDFNDPRIHFGIVCASYSCPRLSNKAFTGDNVDAELTALAKDFVNDPNRNKISENKVELSEIFKWFKDDFTKGGVTLIDFLNKYSNVKISDKAKVSYLKYNWALNE